MIAYPFDIRDRLDIFGELAKQSRFIHLFKENSFARLDLWIATGLHGKMEDDFLSLSVSLSSKSFRIGGERKNGKGDWKIPKKEFLRNFVFSPKVVNDNSNLRAESSFQSGWDRGEKGKLMGDSIQNLYLQMEGF